MRKLLGCLVLATATAGAGCPLWSYCRPTETRCRGNVVEVCDSTEHWARLMSCDEVAGEPAEQWICSEISSEEQGKTEKGHTCLPANETKKGGDR